MNIKNLFPNDFYNLSYIDQIKYLIKNYHLSFFTLINKNKELKDLKKYIDEYTSFIKYNMTYSAKCYCILNNITVENIPKCKTCGKELLDMKYYRNITKGFSQFCSNKCSNSNKDKIKKIQTIFLKQFGTTTPLSNKQLRLQGIETRKYKNNGKYMSDEHKKKFIDAARTESSKLQIRTTRHINFYKKILDNQYIEPLFTEKEFIQNYNNQQNQIYSFQWKCKTCGNIFQSQLNFDWNNSYHIAYARCLNCFPKRQRFSIEEKSLLDYIKSITNELILNNTRPLRDINGKLYEIDIYLPNLKIGFEYDGVYFHSVKLTAKNYHLLKTQIAEQNQIKLVHIRSDEWINNTIEIKKLIYDIIFNNIKFDTSKNILKLDRSKFNKCFYLQNYKLIEETKPEIIKTIKNQRETFDYENCGYLIYQKI